MCLEQHVVVGIGAAGPRPEPAGAGHGGRPAGLGLDGILREKLFWGGTGIAPRLVADHQDPVVRPVLFVRIRPEHDHALTITAPPTW